MPRHVVLSLTLIGFVAAIETAAHAEVITIDGTIKSVDHQKRTITVETGGEEKTLDVSSKAKVSIEEKVANLESLQAGQKVKLSYHDDLEIVLRVEATPANLSNDAAELVELSELNSGKYAGDPWLSPDGLHIYWVAEDLWIWTAVRQNTRSFFEKKERILKGVMPTLSSDELEMIFVGPRADGQEGRSLYVTTRRSVQSSFARPEELRLKAPLQLPGNPCLSTDGLILYFSMVDTSRRLHEKSSEMDKQGAWIFGSMTRKDRASQWSSPEIVRLKRESLDGKLTWIFPLDDRLSLLCAREGLGERAAVDGTLMLWTRDSTEGPFTRNQHLRFERLPALVGRSPRYCAKTKELVFTRDLGEGKFALWMVKNVDLNHFGTASERGKEVDPVERDMKLLAGEWTTITEETNGKQSTKADVKTVNRRIKIEGNRITMRRVQGGQLGTYEGTIDINPSTDPKQFDFTGTGPRGHARKFIGIYEVDEKSLKLFYRYAVRPETKRPRAFKTSAAEADGEAFVGITCKRDVE